MKVLRALYLSTRQRIREARGKVTITVPTTTKSTLPPLEIRHQRNFARTTKVRMYGLETDTGAAISMPNLTFLRQVPLKRSRVSGLSRLVLLIAVAAPVAMLLWLAKAAKRRYYDQRPPFRDYEFFTFSKQVLEDVMQELFAMRENETWLTRVGGSGSDSDASGESISGAVGRLKTIMANMYDYEHGGKLCEIIFDLYGPEIVDVISNSEDMQSAEGEIYSVVDLFRITAAYKTWLLDGDDVQQRQKRAESHELTQYQVCNGRMQQWWWQHVQRPLMEGYITSPLMEYKPLKPAS